jgi:L-ascorbate metabolism protein UlaG (beta-lactamase superfamily)
MSRGFSKKFLKEIFLIIFIFSSQLFSGRNFFYFIGHATVLINIDDVSILTDPNWNDYDLFLKREKPPALKIEDLPKIDLILISHGHFDHLDLDTLKKIFKLNPGLKIFLPKNLGFLMEEIGIRNFKELEPGEILNYKNIEIKVYKARHNGRRYIFSKIDTSLALCYLIKGSSTVFFSGDTGYTNLFKLIGESEKIDIAFLEIQGWIIDKKVRNVDNYINDYDYDRERGLFYVGRHLHPLRAIKVFLDLKAKKFVPIHYDAFFVNFRRDDDPIKILKNEFKKLGIDDRLILDKAGVKFYIE